MTFADFPEAITSGVGRADAVAQAADCLQEAIAGRGLASCLWICWLPAFDAIPVAPALGIAFLLPRSRFPIALLGLPP